MFKPGFILKISVKDFVTYSFAEMTPGPNLNMLIGPNGTGKSTIVAAIILGLGGSPKTVGRGSKISEYIKHNCSVAMIKIKLQGTTQNEFIFISRQFDMNEKSSWTLNGQKVPYTQVQTVTKQLNIQVDNLCQFLPQDRVQEFAKMNKQQLLEQTQIALCKNDLIDKQSQLIKLRDTHKELLQSIKNSNVKLQDFKDANLRIETKVQNLEKKEEYLKNIQDIDRKIAWIDYDVLKTKYDKVKEDKVKAIAILDARKQKIVPIDKAYTNIRKTISNLQQGIMQKNQEVRQSESEIRNLLDRSGTIKTVIANISKDFNLRLQELKRRNQEIAQMEQELQDLVQNKSQIIQTYGDETQREQKISEYKSQLKRISSNINKVVENKGGLESSKRNNNYELQSTQNELSKLENVKQQRLEWLRRKDRDAYAGVQWLRSNKHLFKEEIYEPMVLELNVLNQQHAIYIENAIPIRDRIAFTCVLKEDMNLFIKMARERNLNINVVHSGKEQPPLHSYQPKIPIEQLKRYGFFAYINSLITGPEPIMKYLCKMYHIHNIPVGNQHTNNRFEEIPPQIWRFFTDKFVFSISHSKYTGAKSIKQNEIKSDGSLSISCDTEGIENIRGQVEELENRSRKYNEQINNLNEQLQNLNQQQNGIRNNISDLQKCKQNIDGIDSRTRVISSKLQQIKSDCTTKEQVEKEFNTNISELVKDMVKYQVQIKTAFKKHSGFLINSELHRTRLQATTKQEIILVNKLKELRTLCQETERTINVISASLTNIKNETRAALEKAKAISKNHTPEDPGFEEFREAFDNLTNNLEELASEKEHVLSQIDYLCTATVTELQEFKKREVQIAKLQHDIEQNNEQLDTMNSTINNLQNEWLQPLQELVEQINIKFSDAFRRMGCAGEVTIFKGDDEKDYDQYGLTIKVKYRDAEPLQELNNVIQSGGERAVATAAFMLSLQELTPVPFRCVDEINQGMDINNERRIFELLVDATSQQDTSQYFFITPKLVPNLKFVPSMNIHFVHNGPFTPSQKNWNKVEANIRQI